MPTDPIAVPSTDGVTLSVHDLGGDPDGTPLLWCHATGFHGRVWEACAAEFTHRRNLGLDFRGHGDSAPPADGNFSWHGFSDDVLAVVDRLGLSGRDGGLDAVGHSKGGAALLLAEQARPGTMRRLVCFEPIVFPPVEGGALPGENPLAESARRRRDTFDSHEAAVENFRSKAPLRTLRADVLDAYVRHGFRATEDGRITLKARPEHEARTYENGPKHGAYERLGDVRCPVLVCASGDGGAPAVFAPAIAGALPAGALRTFDGLTHFGPLEDPLTFASVVRTFLGR